MPDSSPWPLVSIVTPSYNQAQFIEETIRSVLLQGYPKLEYIAIDGGSTDGSVDIIRKYEEWITYWTSEPDRGQSHAINKGWRRATGDIIAYLNSDDTYEPRALANAALVMQAHPEWGMVYGDCALIGEMSQRVGYWEAREFNLQDLLFTNRIGQPAVFIRCSALEQVGYLDESLYMVMDRDLWLRIGLAFPVESLPGQHLANHRIHEHAKTSMYQLRAAEEIERVIKRTLDDPRLPFPASSVANRAYGTLYCQRAAMLVNRERWDEAQTWLLRAVKFYPGVVVSYRIYWRWMLPLLLLGGKLTALLFSNGRRLKNRFKSASACWCIKRKLHQTWGKASLLSKGED
jgi:glycosyltransferase involved in cell wall biosynthesis